MALAFDADFFTMFQSLLDAHTTYYLPRGYGAVYYTTPFSIKTRVVEGVQKFYTGNPPYPFVLWSSVCGSSCPFTSAMYGWEITQIDGQSVSAFAKTFTRGSGTYYDDGVRMNHFISGLSWGQSSLTSNALPASATFTVTLIDPSTSSTVDLVLPYGFGGNSAGWSRAALVAANGPLSKKRGDHELFGERLLLDSLKESAAELRKRSDSLLEFKQVESAISLLSSKMDRIGRDTAIAHDILRREGSKALMIDDRLPHIPSPRERMEEVIRIQQSVWAPKMDFSANIKFEEEYFKVDAATGDFKVKHTPIKRSGAAAPTAVEKPLIPGDISKWNFVSPLVSDIEPLNAYAAIYNNTSVLRLRSFTIENPNLPTFSQWVAATTNLVGGRASRGTDENLIIDVTNNGGGLVCLNYETLGFLINSWTNRDIINGPDTLYSLYDMRVSELSEKLYQNGDMRYADVFNATTAHLLDTSYYTEPVSRTIGGKTSSYSKPFNWNPCGWTSNYFTQIANYHFDKIIVLTDGRCGSSCAYFLTHLRENDRVRVVSYGGIYGEAMATSSFAGGNVYTWDYIRSVVGFDVPANPFSAYIAYNARQNFSPSKYPATPRQMNRLEADWYLPIWDSFFRFSTETTRNLTARYALYESILPLFEEMPSGLTRTDIPPPPVDPPIEADPIASPEDTPIELNPDGTIAPNVGNPPSSQTIPPRPPLDMIPASFACISSPLLPLLLFAISVVYLL